MIDILTELDIRGVKRIVREVPRSQVVHSQRHIYATEEWGWEELRDYVASQIQDRFGPFHRDMIKEASIFKRFVNQWGKQAQEIVRYAFEMQDGLWDGKPITMTRFCKNSDPYFAVPITERLADL